MPQNNKGSRDFFAKYDVEYPEGIEQIFSYLSIADILGGLGSVNSYYQSVLTPRLYLNLLERDFAEKFAVNSKTLGKLANAQVFYKIFYLCKALRTADLDNGSFSRHIKHNIKEELHLAIAQMQTGLSTEQADDILQNWLHYFTGHLFLRSDASLYWGQDPAEDKAAAYNNFYVAASNNHHDAMLKILALCFEYSGTPELQNIQGSVMELAAQADAPLISNCHQFISATQLYATHLESNNPNEFDQVIAMIKSSLEAGDMLTIKSILVEVNQWSRFIFQNILRLVREENPQLIGSDYILQILLTGAKNYPLCHHYLARLYFEGQFASYRFDIIYEYAAYHAARSPVADDQLILMQLSAIKRNNIVPLATAINALKQGYKQGSELCGYYLSMVFYQGATLALINADRRKAIQIAMDIGLHNCEHSLKFLHECILNINNRYGDKRSESLAELVDFAHYYLANFKQNPPMATENIIECLKALVVFLDQDQLTHHLRSFLPLYLQWSSIAYSGNLDSKDCYDLSANTIKDTQRMFNNLVSTEDEELSSVTTCQNNYKQYIASIMAPNAYQGIFATPQQQFANRAIGTFHCSNKNNKNYKRYITSVKNTDVYQEVDQRTIDLLAENEHSAYLATFPK